jgi:hypothetical protein
MDKRSAAGPTVSFSGKNLTTADKIAALTGYGLADDEDEARSMLADMGEIDETDEL